MLKFYKKIFSVFFSLVVLTVILTLLCLNRGFVSDVLLPVHESAVSWKFETTTDVQKGGTSSVSVNDSSVNLDYDYFLTEDVQYPHVSALIAFAELQNAKQLVDLTGYSAVAFRVKCAPNNVLAFYLHSFDPKVTDPENFFSYRIAEIFFSCKDEWSEVEIDLRHLGVAEWWLETFGLEISDQNYLLDKVIAFSFCATALGPANTAANVKISDLTLHGRDWRYVWALAGSLVLIWAGFMFWLLRQYTQNLIAGVKKKLQKGRPLMAYQQLSIEPHKDREKTLLLQYIAKEYANPELSVESAVATLGINRTKINDILKKELGFTFTAYVNKLRLTEAARLLSEKDETSVADIAYRVGYNNVTYFNKLFKSEYGYAPKTFKKICSSNEAGVLRSPGTRDDDQA